MSELDPRAERFLGHVLRRANEPVTGLGIGLPFLERGLDFDADLKRRDPEWGLRRVEDFVAAAEPRGLSLEETRVMPANNLMLLLRRS